MRKLKAAVLAAGVVVAGTFAGVGAVAAAPKAPDLVVTGVQWAPGVVAGEQVLFTATIKNTGNAPTPEGVIHGVGFQVDGKLVTWSDTWTSSLAPGSSAQLTAVWGPTGSATWTATSGTHKLRAFVDDAKRMAERNEGNNTLDTTLPVGAGISHRVQNGDVVASVTPLNRPTVTATSVSGNLFAGCTDADGTVLGGTERYVGTSTVGSDVVYLGGKWGTDGVLQLPAGAAQSRTHISFSQLLWSYQGFTPLECAQGTSSFTRFQATTVRTTRYEGSFNGIGAQIATVSTPVDVDLDVVI